MILFIKLFVRGLISIFFSDAYTDDGFERIGIDAVDNSSDHDYGIIICRT